MRTAKVVLNGQTYTVEELRSRANQAWRARLQDVFNEVAGALQNAPALELSDGQAVGNLVLLLAQRVVGAVDLIRDLVEQYAPELPLDEAYDSEIMAAFVAILGLAYPFGEAIQSVTTRLGSLKPATGRS